MNNSKFSPENAAKLRWCAEDIAHDKDNPFSEDSEPLSQEQTRVALHELRVHQIELKMQNEELLRLQVELELAQTHYFELYHLAPVGYCILSKEGQILEANLAAVTMLSNAHSTLIGQPITRFIFKEDQDIYYLNRKQFLITGKLHECELRMVKQDGTIFWGRLMAISTKMTSATSLGVSECRLVLSDITERKHAEEERAKSEAKLTNIGKRCKTRV